MKRTPGGSALVKVILKGSLGTQSLDVVPPNTGNDGVPPGGLELGGCRAWKLRKGCRVWHRRPARASDSVREE